MGTPITSMKFPKGTELESVISIPNEVWDVIKNKFDGHYTIMKFTTNYRFCFDTLDPMDYHRWRMQINKMSEGATPEIAMRKELAFYEKLKQKAYYVYYQISSSELFDETGLEVNCTVAQQSDNVWEREDAK